MTSPCTSARRAAIIIAVMVCAMTGLVPPALATFSVEREAGALLTGQPSAASEARPLGAPAEGPLRSGSASGEAARGSSNWFVQTVLALGAVLALIVLAGAMLRAAARGQGGLRASMGAGGRAPAGILEVLGRYPIARGSTLVLLKIDRRVLLLSQSAQGRFGSGAAFTTLCEITDPEEVASLLVKARDAEGDSMAERFRGLLSRFDRNMDVGMQSRGSGRRSASSGVDRLELWDDGRGEIPVVDLTQSSGGEGTGAIASLRRRLAALRTGEGGGVP